MRKQHRGQSGAGVWRVEGVGRSSRLRVRHAQRGSEKETLDMSTLLQRLAAYFEPANGGQMIDQAWQPRVVDGMVRAYLVQDRVGGSSHPAINALHAVRDGEPLPAPGPRRHHSADLPQFQNLRRVLETRWIERLRQRVGEINVSSVSPFPPSAIEPLVAAVKARLTPGAR